MNCTAPPRPLHSAINGVSARPCAASASLQAKKRAPWPAASCRWARMLLSTRGLARSAAATPGTSSRTLAAVKYSSTCASMAAAAAAWNKGVARRSGTLGSAAHSRMATPSAP